MSIFFRSDDHFGHENILNLGNGRPFNSMNHMHTVMINNHNSIVNPEDEVYFLGDLAMGNFEQTIKIFERMNGTKFLVPGNHDKIFSATNSKKRIETFSPLYEEAGFTILPEETKIILDNQEIILSHFPYHEEGYKGVERFTKNRPINIGLPLIHGHTHQRYKQLNEKDLTFHVGVDSNNFYPVPEKEIIAWLNKLRFEKII